MVDTYIGNQKQINANKEYDHRPRKYGATFKSDPKKKTDKNECEFWSSKGICYREEACASFHEPSEKAKPRDPSRGRRGSPKGGQKGSPKGDERSPSGRIDPNHTQARN